jgi:hypothetical protein
MRRIRWMYPDPTSIVPISGLLGIPNEGWGRSRGPAGRPNGAEGLIWLFSLAFEHTPRAISVERMTIGRLMLALMAAAAAGP